MKEINKKLIEVLSKEKGYFGRVNTWGQKSTKYEFVGYELDTDFYPTLECMSDNQRKSLIKIIYYFEIHANPLKKMIDSDSENSLYDLYSECAWSHFMIVIMFGILEVAVKSKEHAKCNSKGYLIEKCKSIKNFMEMYLSEDKKNDIVKRYKTESGSTLNSFEYVMEHLWNKMRSGFVHEAEMNFKGLEWHSISFDESKNIINIETDVPVQELMQITWQAILNSYGFKGLLKLSR